MTDLMQIISNSTANIKLEEVKEMCGVCDTTLWLWNKRNYLKAIKVGNKVRYRFSDVKRILGETNKISGYGKD